MEKSAVHKTGAGAYVFSLWAKILSVSLRSLRVKQSRRVATIRHAFWQHHHLFDTTH